MSFKRVSAILRSNWLIDKQWAAAHLPLVVNFLKGDSTAFASIMGNRSSMSDNGEQRDPEIVGGTRNVYEVYCGCDLNKVPNGSIAYLDIDGPVFKLGDDCSDGMEDYVELVNAIKISPNISALIIDVDTPGGQANGPASLADAIKKCDTVKPVVGFVNDGYCASAGYFFISGCREIYACQATSQIGSIGAYQTIADIYAYYKSQGLPIRDVYAPQSEDKNQPSIQANAGNDTLLEEELKYIVDFFISTVKQNRKGKIVGNDWTKGKLYFADDALQIGLIDGIKNFEQVVFRVSRLISSSQKNNLNTMAFEKTLAAASASAFAVTDAGFIVTEENLNNIEAALQDSATNAEAVTQANAMIDELQNEKTNLETTLGAKDSRIQELVGQLETANTENTNLKTENDSLKKLSSGIGTVLTIEKDEVVLENGSKKIGLSHPDHPVNVAARKRIEASKKS